METTLLPQIAFGYGRVSTAKQGLSREAQTETVQRAAAFYVAASRESAADCEMFFDEDTSGGIPFARPPLRPATAHRRRSRRRQPAAAPRIIVTKVDRLGRDTVDVSQTVSLLENMGARIVFLDINVDTRTAMGRAFMQIAAVFAELERARIRERIQTALDLKRSQNLVTGTVPYGWDARDTGARNKAGKPIRELVPNEAEQAIILEMARKKIAGVSLCQIAKDLNRRGIPTKRRGEKLNIGHVKGQCQIKAAFGIWTAGIVLKVLTNKSVQAFLSSVALAKEDLASHEP